MKQDGTSYSVKDVVRGSAKACLLAAVALTLCVASNESAQATTGVGPYVVPQVVDINPDPNIVETYIVADEATVNIGNGVMANAQVFKSCSDAKLQKCTPGAIPGPEFRLTVGNQVIVHFRNNLNRTNLKPEGNVSAIHWHGIELNNASDGTEVTQHAVDPGGSFDYNFTVSRPGVFWYHPHHHSSSNQVFKGLYGSIIVRDNNGYESTLKNNNVIPSQALTLVLSDITVCKAPGANPLTYAPGMPHVSGIDASGFNSWQTNYQNHIFTQSPWILCENEPLDENSNLRVKGNGSDKGPIVPFSAGDVPNIQSPSLTGRMGEGFTVLTNGVNVGGRSLTIAPSGVWTVGALDSGASTLSVQAGQGLRLQIVNPSPVRYMRLRLTKNDGTQIDLVRIGGEGGLLNNAVVEGGIVGSVDFKYEQGEILVPPAGRADVVAAIPSDAEGVLTLWTSDFQRVAATYSWTPTVPVMHLSVNGTATPYVIAGGTSLLASLGPVAQVQALGLATGSFFVGSGEQGSTLSDIQLTFFTNIGAFEGSIDKIAMPRGFTGLGIDGLQSTGNPFYLASARHAALSNTLELTVTNTTLAHHPFHLHGFSFQPISLELGGVEVYGPFPLEFRDIMDVPALHTLKFRVSLDDRPGYGAVSGVGGGTGRWLFHCHILPHATFGMMSELHVH